MECLEDESLRISHLRLQAETPQTAYARKAGWVWRYTKSHRKWVKRWIVFDSRLNAFTFFRSPSQTETQNSAHRRNAPLAIQAVTPLKHRLIHGDSKLHGLAVEVSSGKSVTLCFSTSCQRAEWLQFLSDSLATEVTLDALYDVHYQCVVGRGAFADVLLGSDKATGELVAVKMVTRAACKKLFKLMDKEAQIMSMVGSHPHLLRLRHAFYSEDHIFLVSDLLEGGDLMHAMSFSDEKPNATFTEDRARAIFKEVLLAVEWLHDMEISHCDIKPENILFSASPSRCRDSDAHVRLTDFNSATFFDDPTEPGGTPEYMAPELACLESNSTQPGWDSALDMWSMGILLFWMLCGHTPFQADSVPGVLHKIQSARFDWPNHIQLSSDVKSLISSLLQRDPAMRPTAKSVLEHSWVKAEGVLKPLLTIMADTRALFPAFAIGAETCYEPVSAACNEIDNETLAAMRASTPKHLCVRVPGQSTGISYGFAASSAQVIESSDAVEMDLAMELSGLEVSDSLLSIDCPSPSDLASPGRKDPMDSCMSVHKDLSFKGTDADMLAMRDKTQQLSKQQAACASVLLGEDLDRGVGQNPEQTQITVGEA